MNRTKRSAVKKSTKIIPQQIHNGKSSSTRVLSTVSTPVLTNISHRFSHAAPSYRRALTTAGLAKQASSQNVVTRRSFSSLQNDLDATPSIDTAKAAPIRDPVQRFQSRNNFMRRRHLERDHIISTQHNDVRILALKTTEVLREAVKRHNLSEHEAILWGGYMSGAAAYSGLSRADNRIIMEALLGDPRKMDGQSDYSEHQNHFYIEAFGVGEIRGFGRIGQEFQINGGNHPGVGAMRVTTQLPRAQKFYTSTIHSVGDPMLDWQQFFQKSEQLPTYIQTETVVKRRNPDDPRDIEVEFAGAVLVQSLGGPTNPNAKMDILSQKPLARLEDETDDEYVKRCQVNDFRNKVLDIDLITNMNKYGVVGYMGKLVDVDVHSIGHSDLHRNTGNINNDFDYELVERALIQSALREKPLFKINADGSREEDTAFVYQHDFTYKPVHFFCRCYQTPPDKQLLKFPLNLLEDLAEDKGAAFSCDLCSHETVVTEDQLRTAIQAQKERMDQKAREQLAAAAPHEQHHHHHQHDAQESKH